MLFTCSKCGYSTEVKAAFNKHLARKIPCVPEEKELVFHCSVCQDSFLTQGYLSAHEKKCTGVSALQCPTCHEAFKNRCAKSRHVKKRGCSKDMRQAYVVEASVQSIDVGETSCCENLNQFRLETLKKKSGICRDCDKCASYNYPDQVKRLYCASCRLPGMVEVKLDRLVCTICDGKALYHDKNGKYCEVHKTSTSIPTGSREVGRCEHPECHAKATYSAFEGTKLRYCEVHKFPNMVQKVTRTPVAKVCTFPSCSKAVKYGIIGEAKTRCTEHRLPQQIATPMKRCTTERCVSVATHGPDTKEKIQTVCEFHATADMIDLFAKECKSCNLKTLVNEDDLCGYCTGGDANKYVRLSKQNAVRDFIAKYSDYLVSPEIAARIDRQVVTGCIKSRPDFYFDLGDKIVIIEVDEFMHRYYSRECEFTRAFNISQALGGVPVVIIRYNPDAYDKGKKNLTQEERLKALLKKIDYIRDVWQPNAREAEVSLCWCTYMFYDTGFEDSIREDIKGKCHLIR